MAALWFKNLRLYRIDGLPEGSAESLTEALDGQRLNPCPKLEPASHGFASPYASGDDRLVHEANGCFLLRYGIEERVLPAAVVKSRLAERARDYGDKMGRKANRREIVNLRDEVMMELLPKAFIKPSHTDLYLDPTAGWLVINASSQKRAEDIATALRAAFDGLRTRPISADDLLRSKMTLWLSAGPEAADFSLGDACDLCDRADERATVKCRRLELDSSEVTGHLEFGKIVTRLGLIWADRLGFDLCDDFSLARLTPLETLIEQMEAVPDGDEMDRLDADFVFMALEVRALLESLVEAFALPIND